MSWPQPTRDDHDAFCRTEAWERVRDARGRTGTHHIIYELSLLDGRILRTRISHPIDRTTYGAGIWRHILRDQLQVDEEAFWRCVHDKIVPDRGVPTTPEQALPADLVHLLINRVGLNEAEVADMNRDDAIARLQEFWTTGR